VRFVSNWEQHAYATLLQNNGSAAFRPWATWKAAVEDDRTTLAELRDMVTGQKRARKELNKR
jgi:hypothetical protein